MSEAWHTIIDLDSIEHKDVTQVIHEELTLAVYDTHEGVFVSDARCTHAGANLCDGYFDGRHIECPLHQGLFDACTGMPKAAPATQALKMYQSRVQGGKVQIKLP